MIRSFPTRSRNPVAGARRVPWRVSALLIALCAAACESPVAPAACGPLPQVTVNVGETSSVAACFNDANGDMLSYTAASSNPAVATASISGASITVTGIAPGNTTVTVTASDPDGLQGQSSFAVMVPNRAPQPRGTIPNVTVRVGANVTVDAAQYFSEPDGEALTYAASASDGAVASVTVAGSTVTATAEGKGGATITITANDPGGLSATQSFRLTVPNRPPAPVGALQPQTIEAGQSATLDVAASFTDPDGDPLTYTAASSIPAVARTSVSGSVVTITAQGSGTTTVTITASDDDRATATQQVSVTVPQPNRAPRPEGAIPAQTVEVGRRATVNASRYFSDPDGDVLTYAASSSNGGVAGVSVSGSTVTVTAVSPGSATITVTARDPDGLTATQQARVTVPQPNRAPRPVGTVPSQTLNPGGSAPVNASQYFSDPDGDPLTYSTTSSNSGVATASVSGSTVRIRAVNAGSATITVTARDPGGLSAAQRVSVRVQSTGAPDLQFTSVTPTSVTGSPGGTVRATFTLRNSGNATAAATTIRVYQSTNSSISTSDTEIGQATTSSLGAGQSRTITGTVTLSSQASGTFYFGLCADRVSGESNTQNNCSTGVRVTVTGSGAPDLEFTNVTPTSVTGSPGGSVQADFTIENTGNATAPATTIRLYRSSNSTISTSDSEIGTTALPNLGAGQSRTITGTVRNLSSGTFYFGLCADAVSGESDTTNNCSQGVRVTVGGSGSGPDLVVSLSESRVTVSPGGSFSYDRTVRNQGDAASAATRIRTYQSDNSTITTTDTQIGESPVPSLGPSQEASGTRTIRIPAGASAGTTYVGDCVDAVSGESNTNNNCSSAIRVTIQTGSSSDTTYTTGQTIETLPTGFWSPDQSVGGIVFQFSNGVATVRFSGTSSYIVEDNIRYSCLSTGGCEIVNRRVTKGSIRASRQSGGSLIAEPQWQGLLQAVGADGALVPVPSSDEPPRIRAVGGILRIKPGGEPEDSGPARSAVVGATILVTKGREP